MAVAQRKTEREHASVLTVLTVLSLYGTFVHAYKHLTVIQANTHTHSNRCHLIVSPVETVKHLLYIFLLQSDAGVRHRYLHPVLERSVYMLIGTNLNIQLYRTFIGGIFECIGKQVHHDLVYAVTVYPYGLLLHGMVKAEVYVALFGRLHVKLKRSHKEIYQVRLGKMQLHLTFIKLTHVQQLVYQ